MTSDKLRYAIYLTAAQAVLHLYDFTLHAEDLHGVPLSVPWEAPHTQSPGLQLFNYTDWWATYWGVASVLSLLTLYLLLSEVRDKN